MDDELEEPTRVTAAVLEFALANYVRPVLAALVGCGRWSPELTLTRFEVRLPADGDASVQLNDDEIRWSQAWVKRDFEAGETVQPSDFETKQIDVAQTPDAAFIRGSVVDGSWALEFQFGAPTDKRLEHLRLGDEFLASAEDDLAAGRPRAAFAAAFHASEHYAKAELLHYSLTAPLISGSKRHAGVRSAYSAWARLGNSESRFADLLNRLDRERGAATYLNGEWSTANDLHDAITTLKEMRTWVADVVDGHGPTSIRVVATRAIDAGTLVGPEDVSLSARR